VLVGLLQFPPSLMPNGVVVVAQVLPQRLLPPAWADHRCLVVAVAVRAAHTQPRPRMLLVARVVAQAVTQQAAAVQSVLMVQHPQPEPLARVET
jgi:hypothetical protein